MISDKVILITGACGGIGSALIEEFIQRDVKKIYAAGINIERLNLLKDKYPDKITPLQLDVTKLEDVINCQEKCHDIEMLVNNAGVECATNFLQDKSLDAARFEMEVNYFGIHNLCFSFWRLLKEKQHAAIVNILSVASFSLIMKLGTYCASKAAAHFLTQALRKEAESSSLSIFGVYPGYVDTEMTKNLEVEKATPLQIAIAICDGIEKGTLDIFTDAMSQYMANKYYINLPVLSNLKE